MKILLSLFLITLSCSAQNICTLYVSQAFVNVGEQAWTTNSGGSGETPWSPTNISGLRIWLDGNDIVGGADTTVAIWPSRAGWDTIYASNATASGRAKYSTFNGTTNKCSAWFGTNDLYIYGSAAVSSNVSSISYFIVADCDASSADKTLIFTSTGADSSSSRHNIYFDSDEYPSFSGRTLDADTLSTTTYSTAITTPTILSVDFLHSSALAKMYLHTTNVATRDPFQSANNTSATGAQARRLGYYSTGTSRFLGTIAEVLVYVPAISASDRTNLVNYLKTKYNL